MSTLWKKMRNHSDENGVSESRCAFPFKWGNELFSAGQGGYGNLSEVETR